MEKVAKVIEIPCEERVVKPHILAQRFYLLVSGQVAQHHPGRVAVRDVHHAEDDERDAEQHRDHDKQSFENEFQHCILAPDKMLIVFRTADRRSAFPPQKTEAAPPHLSGCRFRPLTVKSCPSRLTDQPKALPPAGHAFHFRMSSADRNSGEVGDLVGLEVEALDIGRRAEGERGIRHGDGVCHAVQVIL